MVFLDYLKGYFQFYKQPEKLLSQHLQELKKVLSLYLTF